ncbi:MAG: amidohydrolase family protein, partial [Halobacteriota archaeon]
PPLLLIHGEQDRGVPLEISLAMRDRCRELGLPVECLTIPGCGHYVQHDARGQTLDAIEGRVVIEDGMITAVEQASVHADDIVVPAFINAHTHLGDSIAKEAGLDLSLEELVAPPDGLKHRLLEAAQPETRIDAMRRSLRYMETGGVGACYDFREGGIDGVLELRSAADGLAIDAVAFGRGDEGVIAHADGYGASGAADAQFDAQRRAARRQGKPFAIHAGETDAGDINPALDLDPDLVVHMVHAEELHLERLADGRTPVVCCPRSNLVTDVGLPPIESMDEMTTVALGTDNVMSNSPSILREMEFTAKLFDLDPTSVLAMATVNPAAILDRPDGVIEAGRPARLVVFDGGSDNLAYAVDPASAIVRRASRTDIVDVIFAPTEPEG